jgi:hypothetical protein
MKKAEAERSIRHLCHQWAEERRLTQQQLECPSFSEFRRWLDEKGYARYLRFRSSMGTIDDAELWFNEEFKQTWRR